MKGKSALTGSLLAALISDAAGIDRQGLEKKLQELEKAPPPAKLQPGAMCYKPAGPQARLEYICPKCGEKTLYAREGNQGGIFIFILSSADTFRRLTQQLKDKGLECRLDESSFCQKCGKDAPQKAFVLETQWPGEKAPCRATLQKTEDLNLLLEFLEGKTIHSGPTGGETPLKDHLPRIRKLLGLDPGKDPDKKNP